MKKFIFVLVAVTIAATSCNKSDINDYSNVQVKLSVSMPEMLTKSNFTQTDPSNPIGGMKVTWAEYDRLTLIVFQGDNANWADKFVYKEFTMPAAADGQTTYDVSSLVESLDLSGFDASQNLKYVVVSGAYFNDSWKEFSIWNGSLYLEPSLSVSEQINSDLMMAETDVQEVPFSDPLVLSGSLHWITSVLAVQFDIDPAADITYEAGSFFKMNLTGPCFVDNYKPITKESATYCSKTSRCIYFEPAGKLSEALDANKCRYFTIPADNMTTDASQKLAGSSISFNKYLGSTTTDYTSTGTIGTDVTIEAGKVYGIKIHVTDTNGDGKPEFTKM